MKIQRGNKEPLIKGETIQFYRGSVHLIGHSLDAHVCGYAGERLPGLGGITGFSRLIVQLMN
jgi:hypothetical protein